MVMPLAMALLSAAIPSRRRAKAGNTSVHGPRDRGRRSRGYRGRAVIGAGLGARLGVSDIEGSAPLSRRWDMDRSPQPPRRPTLR
jgi:hypothetical protein